MRPAEKAPRHALLASVTAHVFGMLDVAVSIWDSGAWHDVHERAPSDDIIAFEAEHGVDLERASHNERCLEEARATKRTVVAACAGLTDLFVPIIHRGRVDRVLVTGPVARSRPTSEELLERWRGLTGRQGHPSDPEFVHYVEATLRTLTLEGPAFASFQKLAEAMALLVAEQSDPDRIYDRDVERLRIELAPARRADRMWDVARAMVDERTSRSWASPLRGGRLAAVGLSRFPEQLIVGLFVDRQKGADPVSEMLRRDAFQRACVDLAYGSGGAASGRIGGHGVTFFASGRGSPSRTRAGVLDLANRAASMARRRFGLDLHLGVGPLKGPLPDQFDSALAAADAAVSRGLRVADDASVALVHEEPFWRDLPLVLAREPRSLPAHFDRYLERVARATGHRLERARAHLTAAFEPLSSAALATDLLGAKSLAQVRTTLVKGAEEASTLGALFACYRTAVKDIADAAGSPRTADRDRSLRRAEQFIDRHYAEACTLPEVARACGLAPSHFSRLFKKKHKVTFQGYLMLHRVERGRQLLATTPLNLARVAQLSGLSSRYYLGRVFKRLTGETPIAYRRRVRG
jgi:AraC-like DNA-binding protein